MSNYDLFAPLYDLEHADLADDIEMYLNLAARCDGPVLELGCGSGRVSVALAQAGFDVTGIDESTAMLALAREHAAQAGVADRLHLEQCDVRRFAVAERSATTGRSEIAQRSETAPRFALAIYPLNGFLHLTCGEDQRAALGNIHQALLPGGLLVVDLPNPHATLAPGLDGQMILRRRFRSPEGHAWLSMTSTQTNLADQVQHLLLAYERVDDEGIVHRITSQMDLRFVYRYEMEYLLIQAGFKPDSVYGTYDLDPYEGDSPSMVFVAYK
jgi:SAM-dependent methyltransferase